MYSTLHNSRILRFFVAFDSIDISACGFSHYEMSISLKAMQKQTIYLCARFVNNYECTIKLEIILSHCPRKLKISACSWHKIGFNK